MAEVSADDVSLLNNNTGPFILLGTRTIIDSPPGGNGNSRLDPGETAQLLIALRNIGNEGVNNVNTLLRSTDPRLQITDSTAHYGSIPAGATRTNSDDPLVIFADPTIPKETQVLLMLLINGHNYRDTIYFRLTVGEIVQTDPIPDGPRQPPLYWAYDDVDSLYPQHPLFSWIEINNLGTQLSLSDDQTVTLDLPFNWQFYGTIYNQISINSNGWVAPGYTSVTAYYNTALPTTTLPGVVCANWDDLYPPSGNGVWYYYDEPNHRFIVEWDSVYYLGVSQWEKFEIIIYDPTIPTPTGDNQIIVQYLTTNYYSSSTVGIQDPTQSIAIQCLFDNRYHNGSAPITPGRAIKYTTAGPTAISEQPPQKNHLYSQSVFPNPAKKQVRFHTNLSGTLTTIEIYDQAGRLIRTLNGNGIITWDTKDFSGKLAPPGIYFCRFKTAEHQTQIKLVLTK